MSMTNTYSTLRRHQAARPMTEFRRRYLAALAAKRGTTVAR